MRGRGLGRPLSRIKGVSDSIAPVLQSAIIAADGLTIALTYDEDLDEGSVPATGDYSLAGTDSAMDSVGISGPIVTLTVDAAIFNFQTVLVDYTAGANPIRDVAENNAANLTNQATTNNSTVTHPVEMDDTNTSKWFDYLKNVTKDGSDLVSTWDNAEALPGIIAGALLQAIDLDKMLWTATGILGDGIRQFMKTAPFTLVQPEFIYMVVKQVSWTVSEAYSDGNTLNSGILFSSGITPNIAAFAGNQLDNVNLAVNTYGIIRILFNGASSKFIVNETTPTTGNLGTNDMGGFTLGANANGGTWSNIEVKEIIIRKSADSAPNEAAIYSYLASKYGI